MMGPENGLPASIASIAVIVHTHSIAGMNTIVRALTPGPRPQAF
jgi:hypothetical protein